jgi:hypothetical protein
LALQGLKLFPQVVAVVAYDEPTEQVQQYAPYTLTVNGAVQRAGRELPCAPQFSDV